MKDTQILSSFQESAPQTPAALSGGRAFVFDACHVGVVLRAVLFVQAVMAVGAMFGTAAFWTGWRAWRCLPVVPCPAPCCG